MSPVKLFLASDCHVSYCALCLRTCFTVPFVSDCVTFLNVLWVCVTRLVVCLVIMSHAFLCSAPNSDLCLTVSHVLLYLVSDCVTCFSMLCGYAKCLIVFLVDYTTCLIVLCVQVMCLTVQYEG